MVDKSFTQYPLGTYKGFPCIEKMPYGSKRRTTRRRQTGKMVTKTTVKKMILASQKKDLNWFQAFQSDTSILPLANPFEYNLPVIAEGTGPNSRVGRKIHVTSLQINFSGYRNNSSVTHDRMRIVVVQIKNNDQAYDYNDVYNTDSTLNTQGPQALRRLGNGDQSNFKILKKWDIDLGYGSSNDKGSFIRSYYKKFKKPLVMTFVDGTANVPIQNNIAIWAISDVAANYPLLSFDYRLRYIV